jgi:hypothetical protein
MQKNKPETQQQQELASKAGEFMIGNDLCVTRLGFGAMRITGDGIWGEPADRVGAVRVFGGRSNWESISSTPRTPTDQR